MPSNGLGIDSMNQQSPAETEPMLDRRQAHRLPWPQRSVLRVSVGPALRVVGDQIGDPAGALRLERILASPDVLIEGLALDRTLDPPRTREGRPQTVFLSFRQPVSRPSPWPWTHQCGPTLPVASSLNDNSNPMIAGGRSRPAKAVAISDLTRSNASAVRPSGGRHPDAGTMVVACIRLRSARAGSRMNSSTAETAAFWNANPV